MVLWMERWKGKGMWKNSGVGIFYVDICRGGTGVFISKTQ